MRLGAPHFPHTVSIRVLPCFTTMALRAMVSRIRRSASSRIDCFDIRFYLSWRTLPIQPYTLVAHRATSPVAKKLLFEAASLPIQIRSQPLFVTRFRIGLHLQQWMASTARALRTTRFLNLILIARAELRCGIVEADSDFAKRLPSPDSVVVGSGISENDYVAQESDRVIGSGGRWIGCANNCVGAWRRRWRRRWRWWRRWWWPRRRRRRLWRWRHGRWPRRRLWRRYGRGRLPWRHG